MCTTKFDMESEQLSLMEEYFTTQETQAVKEETDAWKKQDELTQLVMMRMNYLLLEPYLRLSNLLVSVHLGRERLKLNQMIQVFQLDWMKLMRFLYLIIAICKMRVVLRGAHQGGFQSVQDGMKTLCMNRC